MEKMDEKKDEIMARIKEFQKAKGLSERKLSKSIGIDERAFNYYSRGREYPSKVLFNLLSVYKELSAEWLMRGNGEMYSDASSKDYESLLAENKTLLKTIDLLLSKHEDEK